MKFPVWRCCLLIERATHRVCSREEKKEKRSTRMGEEIKQWRVKTFEKLPSAPVFASQIESENVPAERVGSSTIEAMLSRTAPVFYGDLRSHERVPFPFSTFIDFCKQRIAKEEGHQPAVSDAEEQDHFISGDYAQQVYLAQLPYGLLLQAHFYTRCLYMGKPVITENPDFSLYPRAQFSLEYSQKVVLHAGDALFIPEGW
ncbi:hypothetical protein RCOM_0709440 [Ricinus communis]|uniref:JmjC domain-containing protein n=1 Tax=Ricinus communis TaxID=3988 RepID=B9RR50_RICCO|nr:hypothetical protein RCOM_0709440 [Ricinus communis]